MRRTLGVLVIVLMIAGLAWGEQAKNDWIGVYVGSTIPGYDIVAMNPIPFIRQTSTMGHSKHTVVEEVHQLAQEGHVDCVAVVNFIAETNHGVIFIEKNIGDPKELINPKTGRLVEKEEFDRRTSDPKNFRIEEGQGQTVTLLGDCVTQLKRQRDGHMILAKNLLNRN